MASRSVFAARLIIDEASVPFKLLRKLAIANGMGSAFEVATGSIELSEGLVESY